MRAIIKGFRMTEGIDYNETFAPVPCMSTIRMELAITAKYDLEAKQGDVNTAFLSADMDTEVYVAVPNWFRLDATGSELGYTVRRLLKGIPGIPQGPRLWHKKSNAIYLDAGLKQHRSEFCVYYCLKRRLTLIVWVDDLFLFFPKAATTEAQALWTHLRKHMELDEWDDIDDCLSCVVRRDRPNRTITLSQEPAIRKLLQRLNMQDANGKDTPMTAGAKLTKKDCPGAEQAAVMVNEQRGYRSTVASRIYFVGWTRPDLALVMSQHCKYMHNPGHVHITSLKRVLRYLKQTANYGLKYDFSTAAAMVAKVGVLRILRRSSRRLPRHHEEHSGLRLLLRELPHLVALETAQLHHYQHQPQRVLRRSQGCQGVQEVGEVHDRTWTYPVRAPHRLVQRQQRLHRYDLQPCATIGF